MVDITRQPSTSTSRAFASTIRQLAAEPATTAELVYKERLDVPKVQKVIETLGKWALIQSRATETSIPHTGRLYYLTGAGRQFLKYLDEKLATVQGGSLSTSG
jgi:hypothetical protein